MKKWTTIQLGSREHYAIPRMLHRSGALGALVTDSWVRPGVQQMLAAGVSKALAQRRHLELPDSLVCSATIKRVLLDLSMRIRGIRGWDAIIERNRWFQRRSAAELAAVKWNSEVCFSYSYTALQPFIEARKLGMRCVLGQIDPGPLEHEVVDLATRDYEDLKLGRDSKPPSEYWDEWREELDMADKVAVNSEWSRKLLIRQGVPNSRIAVVPLAYEAPSHASSVRAARGPGRDRKLTVLFLGQVILRKGVGQLFDAIRLLKDHPVRFIIAGPLGVRVPEDIASNPDVEFTGPVDGASACKLYAQADVFLLPTLSDGFAITQLEALAFGVPVVASRNCGDVVTHERNGLILDEVTAASIAAALESLTTGQLLYHLIQQTGVPSRFSFPEVSEILVRLAD